MNNEPSSASEEEEEGAANEEISLLSSNPENWDDSFFRYENNTTKDDIPDDVTRIVVDKEVTEIPKEAFRDKKSLEKVILHEGLVKIGDLAFFGCKSLKNLNVPSTVTEMGEHVFEKCLSLETIHFANEGLTSISKGAFRYCSLKMIKIPGTVKVINDFAFAFCKSLDKILFDNPNNLEKMGKEVFFGCKSLKTIRSTAFSSACGELLTENPEDEVRYGVPRMVLIKANEDAAGGNYIVLEISKKHLKENTLLSESSDLQSYLAILEDDDIPFEIKGFIFDNSKLSNEDDDKKLFEAIIDDLNKQTKKRVVSMYLLYKLYMYFIWAIYFMRITYKHALDPTDIDINVHYNAQKLLPYCIIFLIAEFSELYVRGIRYFFDWWNWVDLTAVALSFATVSLFFMGRSIHEEKVARNVVVYAGMFLCLSFVGYLKSTFIKFSIFVEGITKIIWDLIPFIVTTGIVLVAFTHMYFIQSFGSGEDAGTITYIETFRTVFAAFVGGPEDPPSTAMDYIFSIVGVVILLNVVIAIISNSWNEAEANGFHYFLKSRATAIYCMPRDFHYFEPFVQKSLEEGGFLNDSKWFNELLDDLSLKWESFGFCESIMGVFRCIWHSNELNFLLGAIVLGAYWNKDNNEMVFGIKDPRDEKSTEARTDDLTAIMARMEKMEKMIESLLEAEKQQE